MPTHEQVANLYYNSVPFYTLVNMARRATLSQDDIRELATVLAPLFLWIQKAEHHHDCTITQHPSNICSCGLTALKGVSSSRAGIG